MKLLEMLRRCPEMGVTTIVSAKVSVEVPVTVRNGEVHICGTEVALSLQALFSSSRKMEELDFRNATCTLCRKPMKDHKEEV